MNNKTAEFHQLIDHAIAEAKQVRLNSKSERLDTVIHVLETLKTQVSEGTLAPSQGVQTLGLSREVADWINDLDSPLLKNVGAIEQYYQKYF